MRTLTVIVLLLAVFGASSQCVADCLTQPSAPPCHQHSKGKSSGSEPCKLTQQPVADAQVAGPPAEETPALAETAFQVFATENPPPDSVRSSFSVLRL